MFTISSRTIEMAIAPKRRRWSLTARSSPAAAVAANRTATTSSTLTATTCPTSDSRLRIAQKWGLDPMWVLTTVTDNVHGARTPYRIGRPSAAIVSRSWIEPLTGLDLHLGGSRRLQSCAWLRHRGSAYVVRVHPCFLARLAFRTEIKPLPPSLHFLK